ncbi:hypothetical protein ACFV0R_33045 [Streptomyces sp. NPDC059578]|uniref:hypothetical protein n=1 Tax=unclassified Streptomyces TaxID=2593676 RepID=UPI00365FFC14
MRHFSVWYTTPGAVAEEHVVLEDQLGRWTDDTEGAHMADVLRELRDHRAEAGHADPGTFSVARMQMVTRWRFVMIPADHQTLTGAEPPMEGYREVEDPDLTWEKAEALAEEFHQGFGILSRLEPIHAN